MILIYGIPSEDPIRLLTEELDNLCFPYLMLNQRHVEHTSIHIHHERKGVSGHIKYHNLIYPLSSFTGLYLRPMAPTQLPETEQLDLKNPIVEKAIHQSLTLWQLTDVIDCKVVNKRRNMASNGSKPFQALQILKSGLKVPETLISNDPQSVIEFVEKHEGEVIYKSISGVRSIVKKIDDDDLNKLSQIVNCPVQFQKCIPGDDYRVHVIGNDVFATKIISDAVDYRYAGRTGETSRLESAVIDQSLSDKLMHLNQILGLNFSGIDLRITPEEEVYCFEANPSPAYSYYQQNTDQRISLSLANYLSSRN